MIFSIVCGILILVLVHFFRGNIDMKRRIKNKIFHDKKCQRLCSPRANRFKRKKPKHSKKDRKRIILTAPKELCVFDSTDTTLGFFEYVMNEIKQCQFRSTLYFDLSQVESITPDAVMYLIAIINNTKKLRMFQISCEGNMPADPAARSVFQDAGFFKFVYAPYCRTLNDSTKHMKIQNGTDADNVLAGAFCEFVHSNSDKDYTGTKRLYPMIVELMTNTHQHAYRTDDSTDKHLEMYCNWYIFAQDIGNAIRFVFLDTGVGIPRTVAR